MKELEKQKEAIEKLEETKKQAERLLRQSNKITEALAKCASEIGGILKWKN